MTSTVTFPRLGFQITEKKKTLTALLMTVVVTLMTLATAACPSLTVDTVLADLKMLSQTASVIGAAIAIVSPADSLIISNVAGVASTGLAEIQVFYDAFKASGALTDLEKLRAAIDALKTNLPGILAAAHVVDPAAVRMATAWVGLVTTTLTVILNLIPKLTVGGALTKGAIIAAQKKAGPIPNAASIKARWAWEVCGGDKACAALVK